MKDEWTTPQALYDWLNDKCNFNVDAAATSKNTKCKKFFSKKKSFIDNWIDLYNQDRVFCNPPYSLDREFAQLCYALYEASSIDTVLLLPVRSDRIWYNKLANSKGVRVIPFTGRIHFGNAKGGAFMYSVLFVIGFKDVKFPKWIDAGQFNKKGRGSATT